MQTCMHDVPMAKPTKIDLSNDDGDRPATVNEWLAEVLNDPPTPGPVSGGAIVREMRDALEEESRD